MRKLLLFILSCGLAATTTVVADNHEEGKEAGSSLVPAEVFACRFADGKGMAEYNVAVKKWNAWADRQGVTDYLAWTLWPYYSGPEQDFDVLWLGAAGSAKSLGRQQDAWIADSGDAGEAFAEAIECDAHGNFAVWSFKQPPERKDPSKLVLSFSDCNISDGTQWSDVSAALKAWGEYRTDHGSTAGMWVFFPAYGGGGEEFDFKLVAAWQNLEDQGADWDQYASEGWAKAGELFGDKFSCDTSRVYVARNERRPESGND